MLASLVQLQKHEFQQVFRWDVDFTPLKDLLPFDMDTFSHLCETTEFPTKTIGTADASFKGVKVFQAGIPDFGHTSAFTFVENIKSDMMDILLGWSDLVANTNETVVGEGATQGANSWLASIGNDRSGTSYKVDLPVYRLDSRKNRVYGILFNGAFPTIVAPGGGGDGTTNEFIKPSLTISFDAWYRIAIS